MPIIVSPSATPHTYIWSCCFSVLIISLLPMDPSSTVEFGDKDSQHAFYPHASSRTLQHCRIKFQLFSLVIQASRHQLQMHGLVLHLCGFLPASPSFCTIFPRQETQGDSNQEGDSVLAFSLLLEVE